MEPQKKKGRLEGRRPLVLEQLRGYELPPSMAFQTAKSLT